MKWGHRPIHVLPKALELLWGTLQIKWVHLTLEHILQIGLLTDPKFSINKMNGEDRGGRCTHHSQEKTFCSRNSIMMSVIYDYKMLTSFLSWFLCILRITWFNIPLLMLYPSVCAWLVTQLCPTLWGPLDCSPPGSSFYGILQARILERVAMTSPRGLPDPGIKPTSPASPVL